MTRSLHPLRTLAAAALIALPQAARAQQPQSVTLEEAIQRALTVQPAIVQAEGDMRNAAASRRAAFGSYLPTVTTRYSASRSSSVRVDLATGLPLSSGISQSAGLSASIDIFNGFRREALFKSAGARQNAVAAGYVSQQFAITRDTKATFYTALANAELVRVSEAQVRRAQQQHSVAVEKLRAGSATRSDSLRTRVELGNAQLALLQAQAALATAEANLGRAIGADGPVRPQADSGLAVQPVTVDTAALRIETQRRSPLVEQTEAEASAARAGTWVNRAQYWPTLNLSFNDNRSGGKAFSPFETTGNTTWSLSLNWTLFNGFTRETNQVSASVVRDVAEARAADARRQVDASLTQQLAAMEAARIRIDVTRSSLVAAEEDLRVQQQRYQVGASTILELLNSQLALSQAEVQAIQARFDYLVAKAEVEALIGRAL
jgi:outer membrane protein